MMVRHEWRIGEFTITVQAPDGVPVKGVRVDVKPESRAEFMAAAQAAGGIEALTLPTHDASYAQSAYVYWRTESPEGVAVTDYDVMVGVQEPPRQRMTPTERPHPFFSALAERVERDRPSQDAA